MSGKTIRVFDTLTIRRRNGRPKVLPPENDLEVETRSQEPQVLKAASTLSKRLRNATACRDQRLGNLLMAFDHPDAAQAGDN